MPAKDSQNKRRPAYRYDPKSSQRRKRQLLSKAKKTEKAPPSERPKRHSLVSLVAALLIVSFAAIGAYYVYYEWIDNYVARGSEVDGSFLSMLPELSTVGYSEVDVDVAYNQGEAVVFLTSGCQRIAGSVELYQAESIQRGLNGVVDERPNAHDIFGSTVENFDIDVIMVKITEIRGDSFYGRIIMRQGNKVISIEARPSDATALAVRTGSPVYIKDSILEENAKEIC